MSLEGKSVIVTGAGHGPSAVRLDDGANILH
jgi:hypothetical protein